MLRHIYRLFSNSVKTTSGRPMSTSSPRTKFNIRRATVEDYESVININPDIFGGHDNLPSTYFHKLMANNSYGYVSEVDGIVISYINTTLVDGGQTIVLTSGRVHEGYQRQGVLKQILQHVESRYSSRNMAFTTDTSHSMLNNSFAKLYTVVLRRCVRCFEFCISDLHLQNMSSPRYSNLRPPSVQDLETLMSPKQSNTLFPGGRVVVNCIPLRVDPQNIPFMTKHVSCFYSDNPDRMLSFGSSFKSKRGLGYYLELYGSNIDSLKQHLLKHLVEIIQTAKRAPDDSNKREHSCESSGKLDPGNEKVVLEIFVSETGALDVICDILRRLGISQAEWPVDTQIVLEAGPKRRVAGDQQDT